jgi:hypothetical protein
MLLVCCVDARCVHMAPTASSCAAAPCSFTPALWFAQQYMLSRYVAQVAGCRCTTGAPHWPVSDWTLSPLPHVCALCRRAICITPELVRQPSPVWSSRACCLSSRSLCQRPQWQQPAPTAAAAAGTALTVAGMIMQAAAAAAVWQLWLTPTLTCPPYLS